MNGAQLALIAGGLFLAVKFGLFDKLMAGLPGNTTGANPSNPPSDTSVNQSASTQTQSTSSGSGPTPTGSQTQNPQNPTPTPVNPNVPTGTQPSATNAYGTGLSEQGMQLAEQIWKNQNGDPIVISAAAQGVDWGLYLARKYNWLFNPSQWNWYRSQGQPSWTGPAIPSLENTPGLITVDQYLNALRSDGLAGLGSNNMGRVSTRRVTRYVQ